jgi:hypothetical protein
MYHCSWPEVGYRMWRDRKWRHEKWRHKTESWWFPLGVILFVRGVVLYSQGVFYHVLLLTVVFLLNNLKAADRELYATGPADRGIYTTAADGDRDICRHSRSSSNTHRVRRKNPIIFWKPIIRFCFGFLTDTISIISCNGYIRLQYQTHDDSQAGWDLMVLW